MLIRYDFIGQQNGEDVYGHKFATVQEDVEAWLQMNDIYPYHYGYAGFIPDLYVLPFKIATLLLSAPYVCREKEIKLLHAFNILYDDLIVGEVKYNMHNLDLPED